MDYSVLAPSRKKPWRKDGFTKNVRQFIDKSSIDETRSRIGYWLDHIVFRYIPATKSNTYFQELFGDLHDTLTESVEKSLISASHDFTETLKNNTQEITTELTNRLQLDSTLQLPTNLRQLFQTLDFETKMGIVNISLRSRGDGIKSRHIPIILKFIFEQDNKSRTQGAPRIATIWGYEEPENNLELTKSFELAKDFYEYLNKIQMFVTTHSSSFYGIKHIDDLYHIRSFDPKNIKLYFIQNDEETNLSSKPILIEDNIDYVHEKMGLLPLVTPYIKERMKQNVELTQRLHKIQQNINEQHCPTIFVEGLIDKKILIRAIQLYSTKLNSMLKQKLLVITSKTCAGANWVSD